MANTKEYLILSELSYMDINPTDWKVNIDDVIGNDKLLTEINFKENFDKAIEGKVTGLTKEEWINIFGGHIEGTGDNQKVLIDAMSNWQVIAYKNDNQQQEGSTEKPTGFCATAFKNTVTNEIVFAFRGTEPDMVADGTKLPQDFLTDYALAVKGEAAGAVNQFKDAETFFEETMENMYRSEHNESLDGFNLKQYAIAKNVTFAGHSLGGGLAQYMTYYTKDYKTGGLEAVTFNGVGIGQVA